MAKFLMLGNFDLAFMVEFPGTADTMRASVEIVRRTGIAFRSYPAIPVDEFDRNIT